MKRPLVPILAVLGLLSAARLPDGGRAASADGQEPAVVQGFGLLRGAVLRLDPFFRFERKENVRAGVLGTLHGTTREFESIALEFGADRSVLTAAQRAAYEARRFSHAVARGQLATTEVRNDGCVVRMKLTDAVFAAATRQVGRTVVFVRGESTRKDEAGLLRLVKAAVGWVTVPADEVDGWLPAEIKATWTRAPSPDLLVTDDGTLEPETREAVLKTVRDAHALARRTVGGGNVAGPPIVRITKNRDLMAHASGRRDLRDADAVWVPFAAELIVAPRRAAFDASGVAAEAAAQALHHLVGSAHAEPVLTGLRRYAAAVAEAGPSALLRKADEDEALARVRAKEAFTWSRLLRLSRLSAFLAEDAPTRSLDAALAVASLAAPGSAAGRTSLAAWAGALRKSGDPDAASEAAYAVLDAAKSDAEFWAFWGPKADPTAAPPGKPGTKPPGKTK